MLIPIYKETYSGALNTPSTPVKAYSKQDRGHILPEPIKASTLSRSQRMVQVQAARENAHGTALQIAHNARKDERAEQQRNDRRAKR